MTQAVATDAHLSPLLGTHGELLFETNFALDPIQKYGFMAILERGDAGPERRTALQDAARD